MGFMLQDDPEADSFVATFQTQLERLPSLGNKTFTAGVALYAIDRLLVRNKYVRLASKVTMMAGAYEFGRRRFTAQDALRGDEWDNAIDAETLSGVIDGDDIEIMDGADLEDE